MVLYSVVLYNMLVAQCGTTYIFIYLLFYVPIMNNSVLFTSYFNIFLLVVVFVFSHSSIPVWLVIGFLELT